MDSTEARAQARSAFMQADLLDSIPHAKTHHTFLDANAQAHHSPLWAFADIIDNSREAWATKCSINMRGDSMIEIVDDGEGMSEYTLSCAISIAFTKKDFTTGKHYGMGVTTAVPRLAKNALCFSYDPKAQHYTVAFLSTALSQTIGSDELKLPQCTWSHLMPGAIMQQKVSRFAPFSQLQRQSSLSVILSNSPFKSEAELLAEFVDLGEQGTKWFLFDLRAEELELQPESHDVGMRGKAAASGCWAHEYSLRGFLEILYYYDNEEAKREQMKMTVLEMPVMARNWTTFLHNSGTLMTYRPQGGLPTSNAKMSFGYAKPLKEVIAAFEDRGSNKNKAGSSFERLSQYMGIFYYHQGEDVRMPARLTMPLEKTALQCRTFGAMQNTNLRLATLGKALVGCCRENYLVQAHNKSEYVVADSSTAQQLSIFALKSKCSEKMADFLKHRIFPSLQSMVKSVAYGSRKRARKPWEEEQEAVDDDDDDDDDDDQHHHRNLDPNAHLGSGEGEDGSSSACEGGLCGGIEEGGRYELRSDPSVVGFAVWASKSHDLVRLRTSTASGRGRVGKAAYRPDELRPSKLNISTITMVPWRLLNLSALHGAQIEVWWEHDESESSRGEWYTGKLAPKQGMPAGWFQVVYDEEGLEEDVFLGIQADANDDYEHLAFRADGTDIKDEIRLDAVAFAAASRSEQRVDAIATEVVEVFQDSAATTCQSEVITLPSIGEGSAASSSSVSSDPLHSERMDWCPAGGGLDDAQMRQQGAERPPETAKCAPAAMIQAAQPLHSDDQQVALRFLRDQVTRISTKLEAQASDHHSEVEMLNEQLTQAATAKAKVDKRFADLKDSQERTGKRVDQLTQENDNLKRQLQQAKRELRAADRVTQENRELQEQLQQAKRELQDAQQAEIMPPQSVERFQKSHGFSNGNASGHGVVESSIVDCGLCWACLDKPKFGGRGIKRQKCRERAAPGAGPRHASASSPVQTASAPMVRSQEGTSSNQVSSTIAGAQVIEGDEMMENAEQEEEEEEEEEEEIPLRKSRQPSLLVASPAPVVCPPGPNDSDDEEEVAVDIQEDQPQPGQDANPGIGDRVQVEWLNGPSRGTYTGEVDDTDWKINSSSDGAFEFRYHVKYDDGDKRWETLGDVTVRLTILKRAHKPVDSASADSRAPVLGRTRRPVHPLNGS